jgi:hypothetical protein
VGLSIPWIFAPTRVQDPIGKKVRDTFEELSSRQFLTNLGGNLVKLKGFNNKLMCSNDFYLPLVKPNELTYANCDF